MVRRRRALRRVGTFALSACVSAGGCWCGSPASLAYASGYYCAGGSAVVDNARKGPGLPRPERCVADNVACVGDDARPCERGGSRKALAAGGDPALQTAIDSRSGTAHGRGGCRLHRRSAPVCQQQEDRFVLRIGAEPGSVGQHQSSRADYPRRIVDGAGRADRSGLAGGPSFVHGAGLSRTSSSEATKVGGRLPSWPPRITWHA